MDASIDSSKGIRRRDLQRVRQRFLALNREKLDRILDGMLPAQRDFIHLLPLLFHINEPKLPGFVDGETPAGIAGYRPERRQLEIARELSSEFRYQRRVLRRSPIQALYLMGSVGSIGQSTESDLDIWLCHGNDLSTGETRALAVKVKRLELWAQELGLEVHIFPMDVEGFRRGKTHRLTEDSSGSTQHGLLLEEFYRSGLLLAGRYPLWWLVPPEHESSYAAYALRLMDSGLLNPEECLDFGGLSDIPAEEFFGAGLWQLFKGIKSPYKSLLKILLIEAYVQAYPHPDWLALQIKRAVYADVCDAVNCDPYLLMYRYVEAYLKGRGWHERLELARRCLYLKVGVHANGEQREKGWRARLMLQLTREWGWHQSHLLDLDTQFRWKIDRVTRECTLLVQELTRSYRLLTDFAAGYGDQIRVDPKELNLLGRKLYTALEQRPGKVDWVNPGISEDLSEPELSFHWDMYGEGQGVWSLFRGLVDTTDRDGLEPIKVTNGLTELIAWSQINGIGTAQTRLKLHPLDGPIRDRELHELTRRLRQLLPDASGLETPLAQLTRPPYPVREVVLVNVAVNPRLLPVSEGMRPLSDCPDPLSCGPNGRCLLQGVDLVVHTSWGELVVQSYRKNEALLDALCFHLDLRRHAPEGSNEARLNVEGFATAEDVQLARRVAGIFRQVDLFFDTNPNGRFVIGLGKGLYQVEATDRGFRWTCSETEAGLLDWLSQPRGRYSPPGCDSRTLTHSPLPVIFDKCQPGEQQLFYHCNDGRARIYILDESGSLFHQELPTDDPRYLLIQQQRFLDSVARLRRLSGMAEEGASLITGPRFYRLEHVENSGWSALPVLMPRNEGVTEFLELRLVAESVGEEIRLLSLVCGDQQFSFLTLGDNLYRNAVKYILGFRRGGDYPIYLTAVEVIQVRYGIPPSGVELLVLKRRVERYLNETLSRLRVGPRRVG